MFSRSKARRNAARKSGHTLMELMVVMALLVISASLVLPLTVRAYASFKLRLAADSIVRLMQQAKSRALFEGRTYFLVFPDPGAPEREITLAREDGVVVGHYVVPIDISLESFRVEGDESTEIGFRAFYPDGTSDAIELTLKNASSATTRIELDPMTARSKIVLVNEVEP
jgi:prepilin-type N-terminal cleavage/methylation domain-containing protein